jgi:hypothetical protein
LTASKKHDASLRLNSVPSERLTREEQRGTRHATLLQRGSRDTRSTSAQSKVAGPADNTLSTPPTSHGWKKEVTMFETIDEEVKKEADAKTSWIKAGIFVVALCVLGAITYFFAFVGIHK